MGGVQTRAHSPGQGRCVGLGLLGLIGLYSAPAHAYGTGGIEYIPGILGLVIVLVVSLAGYVVVGAFSGTQRAPRSGAIAVGSVLLGGLLGIATVALVLFTSEADAAYGAIYGTVAPPVVAALVSNLGLFAVVGATTTKGKAFGIYVLMCVVPLVLVGVVLGLLAAALFA